MGYETSKITWVTYYKILHFGHLYLYCFSSQTAHFWVILSMLFHVFFGRACIHVHLFTILFYDKLLRKENPINHKVKIHELIHIEFPIAWSRYLKQIFIPFFTILIQGNGSDSFLQNKINAGYFYGTPSCFCIRYTSTMQWPMAPAGSRNTDQGLASCHAWFPIFLWNSTGIVETMCFIRWADLALILTKVILSTTRHVRYCIVAIQSDGHS